MLNWLNSNNYFLYMNAWETLKKDENYRLLYLFKCQWVHSQTDSFKKWKSGCCFIFKGTLLVSQSDLILMCCWLNVLYLKHTIFFTELWNKAFECNAKFGKMCEQFSLDCLSNKLILVAWMLKSISHWDPITV